MQMRRFLLYLDKIVISMIKTSSNFCISGTIHNVYNDCLQTLNVILFTQKCEYN